jgi:hypothetical protein
MLWDRCSSRPVVRCKCKVQVQGAGVLYSGGRGIHLDALAELDLIGYTASTSPFLTLI